MVRCPKCGSKNDKSNDFCLECGTNLKSLETTKFNKKAILLGLLVIFFLNWIGNLILYSIPNLSSLSLLLWAVIMIFIFFISGVIRGYSANKLYISSAILNGLVVGSIYAIYTFIPISKQYPVIYTTTYISLILMIISCGLGGSLGGYLKLQKGLNLLEGNNKEDKRLN